MESKELLELFAEGLGVDSATLSLDTRIADVEEWNSLGWLSIMALVDERLGIQIESREMPRFTTVKDLVEYVTAKTGVAS